MTLISSNQNSKTVFEFNSACPIELWQVVDDVVMGGKSSGNFTFVPIRSPSQIYNMFIQVFVSAKNI